MTVTTDPTKTGISAVSSVVLASGGDDTANIQNALNTLANNPVGGQLYLPAGTYHISNTLYAGSNVAIRGDGIGRTIIRSTVASYPGYQPASGVQAYAAIALVAASHSSVSGLTIDHQTASTSANGIIMVPDGASGAGTYCSDCQVTDCEILAYAVHSYQIWNQRGQHIKILRNYVNGGTYNPTGVLGTDPDFEGVESMGGYDVLIEGNTLLNLTIGVSVGGGSGIAGTDARYVRVVNNYVNNVDYGTYCQPAYASSVSSPLYDIAIVGNQFVGALNAGVGIVTTQASALGQDFVISDNQMTSCQQGVYINNAVGATIQRGVIIGNIVTGASSVGQGAITVYLGNDWKIHNNLIDNASGYGYFVYGSSYTTLVGNTLLGCAKEAIHLDTVTKSAVKDNILESYNSAGGYNGIQLTSCSVVEIAGNLFDTGTSAESYPVNMGSDSDKIRVKDNRLLYIPAFATPFQINCTNPYEFDVVIASGTASTSVAHALSVYSGIRLNCWQTTATGVATPIVAYPNGTHFVFNVPASAATNLTYRCEIMQ